MHYYIHIKDGSDTSLVVKYSVRDGRLCTSLCLSITCLVLSSLHTYSDTAQRAVLLPVTMYERLIWGWC